MLGDYQAAVPFADEGLATWRALGDAHGIAVALLRRGQIALGMGDYQLAAALLTEARALFRDIGGESGPEVPAALWLAEVAQALDDHDRAQQLYDEVLSEARARGDGHAVAHALRELARLRREQGDPEQAHMLLRESAALLVPLKDIRCSHICLEDLAGVLSEHGRPTDVARLFAAAEGLRELIGKPLTRAQVVTHDRDVATVERRLDPESFATAWAEGRAMTLEQAIAYALDRPTPT
jgi:tetratricopeptide (TPR) repeat protein